MSIIVKIWKFINQPLPTAIIILIIVMGIGYISFQLMFIIIPIILIILAIILLSYGTIQIRKQIKEFTWSDESEIESLFKIFKEFANPLDKISPGYQFRELYRQLRYEQYHTRQSECDVLWTEIELFEQQKFPSYMNNINKNPKQFRELIYEFDTLIDNFIGLGNYLSGYAMEQNDIVMNTIIRNYTELELRTNKFVVSYEIFRQRIERKYNLKKANFGRLSPLYRTFIEKIKKACFNKKHKKG